jgi:DNA invertase Pin-like site-specific DNA recombinase
MTRFGYIYLDKTDPDVTRQALQLDSIGEYARIFVDRPGSAAAGASAGDPGSRRPSRQKLIDVLQTGDVVYTASLDRWCDHLRDFTETSHAIEMAGADLCILAENLDTRSAAGRQAIKLLRGFEKLEFLYQSGRRKAGIEAARQNGRKIGRPLAAVPPGFRKICREWSEGRISGKEAARVSGLRITSFYTKAAELGFKAARRRSKPVSGNNQPPGE